MKSNTLLHTSVLVMPDGKIFLIGSRWRDGFTVPEAFIIAEVNTDAVTEGLAS